MSSHAWRDEAACLEAGPEVFFPETGDAVETKRVIAAFCKGCAVRQACLDDAMRVEGPSRDGIRGGLSARGRARLAS